MQAKLLFEIGTGKTVTGARLACLFAERNKSAPAKKIEADAIKPKIMYCGPSNKSVDVIASKFK